MMHLEPAVGQGVGVRPFHGVDVGQRHFGKICPTPGEVVGIIAQGLPPRGIPVQAALHGFLAALILGGHNARADIAQSHVPDADFPRVGRHISLALLPYFPEDVVMR